jgi:hypothetical protein
LRGIISGRIRSKTGWFYDFDSSWRNRICGAVPLRGTRIQVWPAPMARGPVHEAWIVRLMPLSCCLSFFSTAIEVEGLSFPPRCISLRRKRDDCSRLSLPGRAFLEKPSRTPAHAGDPSQTRARRTSMSSERSGGDRALRGARKLSCGLNCFHSSFYSVMVTYRPEFFLGIN